jgi:23S rRNA (adenine2503-C2)-methyltransferase
MPPQQKEELLGLNNQELTEVVRRLGEPDYRGKQLFEALYRQRVSGLEDITTLPRELRQRLAAEFQLGLPRVEKKFVSCDGTVRFLMALGDGELVETVWMPEGDGGEAGDSIEEPGASNFDRATVCVSSQVGCAVNCQFCLTALLGVKRSLTAGEIAGQIVSVLHDLQVDPEGERINLVFMGMGEPFLNYESFIKAVRLLVQGVGIAESRMTVSTAGIVPRIWDFGRETVRPKLAISLNASNDEIRSRLMPINRKWNLRELLAAAAGFPLRPRERLTFEYVLLDDVNDSPAHARELVGLLGGLRCKVNLIALNPGPGIAFTTPSSERVKGFQDTLAKAGIPAFLRRPRGRDIYAACGQLKKTVVGPRSSAVGQTGTEHQAPSTKPD